MNQKEKEVLKDFMRHYVQAATTNVEKHIGDVANDDMDADQLAEEMYTLAFDGAVDAGCPMRYAQTVAKAVVGAMS